MSRMSFRSASESSKTLIAKSALRRYVVNQFSHFDGTVATACRDFDKLKTLNPDLFDSREEEFGEKYDSYQELKDESLAQLECSLKKCSSTKMKRLEERFIDIFAKTGRLVYTLVVLARNPEP